MTTQSNAATPADVDEQTVRAITPPSGGSAPLFNEEEALGFMDGDRELLGQLAASFCENTPALMQNLKDGIARRDAQTVVISAHTLKGSARMFAAAPAVAAALAAEQAGKAGDWPALAAASQKLETEMARLLPELAKISTVTA